MGPLKIFKWENSIRFKNQLTINKFLKWEKFSKVVQFLISLPEEPSIERIYKIKN